MWQGQAVQGKHRRHPVGLQEAYHLLESLTEKKWGIIANMGLVVRQTWLWILILLITTCVTLEKLLKFP